MPSTHAQAHAPTRTHVPAVCTHACPHTHTHTRPGAHRHTLTRTHVPAWAHTLVHISRQLTASPRCATLRLCLDCARDPRGLGRFAPWGSDAPFPAPSGDFHSPVRREQHTRGALGADSALWSLVVWPPARGSRSAPRIRAPSAPASAADPGRAAPARRPRGLGRRFICFSVNRADCFAVCLRFPPGNIGGEEPDAPPWAERRGRRGQTWPHRRLPGSCDEDALFLAICNAGLGFKLPLLNESASPWASLLSTGHPVPEAGNPFT